MTQSLINIIMKFLPQVSLKLISELKKREIKKPIIENITYNE